MSLEDKIAENTAQMKQLTAALQGKAANVAGAAPAAGAGKAAGKGAGKPKKTAEEVMAAAVKVKKDISKEAASFLIAKHGADVLKNLKPDVYDAFVADCELAIEAGEVDGMGGDDDAAGDI